MGDDFTLAWSGSNESCRLITEDENVECRICLGDEAVELLARAVSRYVKDRLRLSLLLYILAVHVDNIMVRRLFSVYIVFARYISVNACGLVFFVFNVNTRSV